MSATNQQLQALEASIQLARQKFKAEETDSALQHIKEGLHLDQHNAQLLEIAADIYLRANNYEKAVQCAKQLITHHPSNPHGYSRHAQALLKQKRPSEAQQIAIDGLKEVPKNQQLLALASESYQALRRWDDSLILANQLIEFHPNLHLGYLRAAQNLLKLNRADEASLIAERGLDAAPNHPHLHGIASESFRARHQHNRSLEHAKALIKNQPDSIEGHKRTAQDLLKLGLRNEAILIIEQLIQRNKSKRAAGMASKLFEAAGQTSRSLVLTTKLAKASDATDNDQQQWISNLFSCREIDLALSRIKCDDPTDTAERRNTLRNLLCKPLNTFKKLSNLERQLIKEYDLYYHLSLPNFNPTQADLEQRLSFHNKIILLVVHVGKCAGESIITALEQTFSSTEAEVIEYHTFDSNMLIKEIIPLLRKNSSRIHIVVCTRNPLARWISAFNWDHHTFFLSNQFYCPDRVIQLHRQYSSALKLTNGLMRSEAEAHELCGFKHLAYGHMAKGISWYLPKEILDALTKPMISTINVETIQSDFDQCVHKITTTFSQLNERKPKRIPKTKQNYQQWHKPGAFSAIRQFSDAQKECLERYLIEDDNVNNKLNKL